MVEIFDCHNHTAFSHDSNRDVASLFETALKKGVSGFAVTDHCDIEFCKTQDVKTPIMQSVKETKELREIYKGKLKVMAGVELGEAIWYPEYAEDVIKSADYDIIIGSVHAVRSKYNVPFSKMTKDDIAAFDPDAYLSQYFYDMLEMSETVDFDVLAHLTVPLRYMVGRLGLTVDIDRFADRIEEILKSTVKHGRALEINTSNLGSAYDCTMPTLDIAERFISLGGDLLTICSDSHNNETFANRFERVVKELKSHKITELCRYENRKPIKYSII